SKAIKYKKEIIPIIIQLPPKVKISKIDYPIIGRSYEANTIFLTQLPGIKLLEGLNKKVDNNEEFNDCDLLNFSLLPSLYQQFKKEDIFITLISGMFKIIPHIKDPINQQFCLTVFMSFLRMYFPDHLVKYIHSEANVMKFAELMQPFYNLVEAQGVTKGRAQERAEKEKALLESAKDLLGRGFSVEDAAKITTLEIEKVQALVA
ncbi:MAG: hypothetical protein LBT86_02430, partial [Deltaproteobacteria bacterium]|nr:hypothetical protein [Deltaproteobacteria bacterium]